MRRQKIGYGLIGLGEVSLAHEKGYREAAEVAEIRAVCDLNPTAAAERAGPYMAVVYTDYNQLLDDERIDAVDVMLPHHLHYPVVKAALQHGKHVLVEKPMTVDAGQALELIRLAGQQKVNFTVAENTRFVTAYIEAEKLIRGGLLGDLRLVRTFIYGSEMVRLADKGNWIHDWEASGGGATMDMAPHSLFLLKWLFGEFADIQTLHWQYVPGIEVADNSFVAGHLKTGGIFTTQYTETVEVPWGERLEAYGSKGSIIIDQLSNPVAKYFCDRDDFQGRIIETVPYDPQRWKVHSMIEEVKAFARSIWDGVPPVVDPMDGYYVVRAINKAYESAKTGYPVEV